MTLISTVVVPVQPTTRAQTNPIIYGTVVNPGMSASCFTTDPTLGTPIDEASYDAEILDWAHTRVAEAIRACASDPCVVNTPSSQITMSSAGNVAEQRLGAREKRAVQTPSGRET